MMHILYTEDEGGSFQHIAQNTDEATKAMFDKIVRTGMVDYQTGDKIVKVRPAYVALLEVVDDMDFVIKRSRIKHG